MGKKHHPHYRIIVIKARTKRDGEALEQLGHYSPFTKELVINKELLEKWIKFGAQPTDTVKRLLVKEGLMEKPKFWKKFNSKPGEKNLERKTKKAEASKTPEKKEEKKVETPAKVTDVKEDVVEDTKTSEE